MDTKKIILNILENSCDFISGEKIAKDLNISRASVLGHIKSLRNKGYNILSITNKGHKLINSDDDIIVSKIQSKLPDKYCLEYLDVVDSTNTYLHNIADYKDEGYIVLAKEQTKGRGRRGRTFLSPNGGIYMSILLKPDIKSEVLSTITSRVALAVCKAIESSFNVYPKIKWVNDLYLNNKKICGILTEANYSVENSKLNYVIVGIGVNVYLPQCGFDESISNIAGYILENKKENARNDFIINIIKNIFEYYKNIESNDYISEYKERCFILNKNIYVLKNNEKILAKAIDVDDRARLLVKYNDGTLEYLDSGEVSIIL